MAWFSATPSRSPFGTVRDSEIRAANGVSLVADWSSQLNASTAASGSSRARAAAIGAIHPAVYRSPSSSTACGSQASSGPGPG